MEKHDEKIELLCDMISKSKRCIVFTGAGISTESGIPDFRSPGGIWEKYQPIQFQDFMASEEMRKETWRRKFATDDTIGNARPNKGHLAIAKLVNEGKVSSVITQNIDGLHQLSGIPEEKVIELHGNATYATCLMCGKRYELGPIREVFLRDEILPECDDCDGIVKSATISFGQAMPEKAMMDAQRETLGCDLFIAMGSSLVVFPAAGFPELAKRNGASLVIINREPTAFDSIADLVFHRQIGPTFSMAVGLD
ncbi:NAD-dependent deacetylase [Thermodesulfobacteriota bacterium]